MKKYLTIPLLFILYLTLCATQCEDENEFNYDDDQTELINLKSEIESLVSTSVCNENTECKYIAFGSKPCGGPWSYLIYSSSIDTNALEMMVENYNEKESVFNERYGTVSDCAIVSPPTSISCENNICVGVN